MPGNDDLEQACLELALAIKIVKEPISSYDARGLANRFLAVAEDRIYLPLDIDRPLVTRAVRYLTQVHAIPPMGDDTLWSRICCPLCLRLPGLTPAWTKRTKS